MDRDVSEMAHKVFPTEPDGSALYPAAGQQRIVAALQNDITENTHIVCVTGPLGSGKTTVLRSLRKCYTKGVVGLLEQPKPGKVLVELTKSLQLDSSEANESFLRRQLAMLLSMADKLSHPIIQIVDGADLLPPDDLNLLLHFFPPGHATLVLAGVSPPEAWLADCVTSIGAARIHERYALEAFTAEETTGYIRHRLRAGELPEDKFTAKQLATIYQQSNGWPGAINRLCAELLVQGDSQPQMTTPATPAPEAIPEPAEFKSVAEPEAELPRPATETAVPVYAKDEAAAEIEPTIPPVAAPSRQVATVTQVERVVVEPMPWRAQRLRRSVRLWRAATIMVSGLLAVVLLQDAWIEHSIFERPVLGGLATLGHDPTAADASSSTPSEITPGEITATGEPVNSAESPRDQDQSADFAALHPASSQTQQPPLTSASETGPSASQPAISGTAVAPAEAPRVVRPEPPPEAPAQANLTEPPEPTQPLKPAARPAPVVKPEPPPMSRAQREEVARLYAERAAYEWRKGELTAAAESIRNGLATDPRNSELLELRDLLQEVDPYR